METYTQAVAKAKARYKEAMEESAWDALAIVETHGRPLQTVCKDIAGDGWQALRAAARRKEKAAGQTAEERGRARDKEWKRVRESHARAALKDPEQAAKVIASLPPAALEEVYHEARLARAGEDRTPPARKAAKAASAKATEPMKRAVAATDAALGIQALDEAFEDLGRAIAQDSMTAAQVRRADSRVNDIANLLMEAKFKTEVGA